MNAPFLFTHRTPEPEADMQNDPVSPRMRQLWLDSDRLLAEQDRAARRADLRGDLRAIGWGLLAGVALVAFLAWCQS